MKNKINQTEKKTKKNKLIKAKHKTRLTQNNKAKYTSNAKQKYEGERERISEGIIWSPFPSTP